ncbi:isochorismatase family protein [Maribacter antarcticus]|uniref:isochorismatase family protein n=1 Tax=Maribacter antarcticus TaxID=505250 RepID=UPI00373FD2D2
MIDMQKGCFTLKTPRYDTKGVVQQIHKLAQVFRKQNNPVIYTQHDRTGIGVFEKNTPD